MQLTYDFLLPDGREERFVFTLDTERHVLVGEDDDAPPKWTALSYNQCSHCPLDVSEHPRCPAALAMSGVVARFGQVRSYDEMDVVATIDKKKISIRTTAQRGISSLMGFLLAMSGCPHTRFLKPMARFHHPFATEEETIFRATSIYLLGQYFIRREGGAADDELAGLSALYGNLQTMNSFLAKRVRAAAGEDSTVNAVIVLGMFAVALPTVIEESLDEIRYILEPLIDG